MADHPQITPEWFRVKPGSDYSGVKPGTFRSWFKLGLPHVKVKGTVLVKREWLDRWLAGFAVGQDQGAAVDRIVDEVMEGLNG